MMQTSRVEDCHNPCIPLSNMQANDHSREATSCMETDDLPNIPRNVHSSRKGSLTMENVEGYMNGCVENKGYIGSSPNQV